MNALDRTLATAVPPLRQEAAPAAPAGSDGVRVSAWAEGVATALEAHPMRSLFSSRPWMEAIRATYGFSIEAATLTAGGTLRAALLFSEIEDIRGRRILSLPFSDYVDPLIADEADFVRLAAPLLERGAPVRLRCLRNPLPAADPRFVPTGSALWHAADLVRPEDEIFASLDGQARQNIRRAERGGLKIRIGRRLEDFRIFHDMHAHVRKAKYRMFAQPFAFFEALHGAFSSGDRAFALLAEVDGAPVGGILFIVDGDTLYYKFNASIETALRPNDLLVWTGMKIGRELGLKRLDFGLSDTAQPGLVRFKQKFATEERSIAILTATPEGFSDRRGADTGRVLSRLTEILTAPDIADEATRKVGDEIYRFFC